MYVVSARDTEADMHSARCGTCMYGVAAREVGVCCCTSAIQKLLLTRSSREHGLFCLANLPQLCKDVACLLVKELELIQCRYRLAAVQVHEAAHTVEQVARRR